MKRKFVLVEVTYTLEGDQQKHSKNHLVSLYVKNNLPSQQSQEMEMATDKARLWYNEVFPQKKIISIVPSETISSDFSLRTLSNDEPAKELKAAFTSSDVPPLDERFVNQSIQVLIDVNGHKKRFELGYYRTDENAWYDNRGIRLHNMEEMVWQYLPK
jgi:hypothetical protein